MEAQAGDADAQAVDDNEAQEVDHDENESQASDTPLLRRSRRNHRLPFHLTAEGDSPITPPTTRSRSSQRSPIDMQRRLRHRSFADNSSAEPPSTRARLAPSSVQVELPTTRQNQAVTRRGRTTNGRGRISIRQAQLSTRRRVSAAQCEQSVLTCEVCKQRRIDKILVPCGHPVCRQCGDEILSAEPICYNEDCQWRTVFKM